MTNTTNYFLDKGKGFYLALVSFLLTIFSLVFYLKDASANNDLNVIITTLLIGIIVLEICVIITSFMKKNIDKYEIIPILSGIGVSVAFGLYLSAKVDVLGYIFTNHYSFEKDYPFLGLALCGLILTIIINALINFFPQRKS